MLDPVVVWRKARSAGSALVSDGAFQPRKILPSLTDPIMMEMLGKNPKAPGSANRFEPGGALVASLVPSNVKVNPLAGYRKSLPNMAEGTADGSHVREPLKVLTAAPPSELKSSVPEKSNVMEPAALDRGRRSATLKHIAIVAKRLRNLNSDPPVDQRIYPSLFGETSWPASRARAVGSRGAVLFAHNGAAFNHAPPRCLSHLELHLVHSRVAPNIEGQGIRPGGEAGCLEVEDITPGRSKRGIEPKVVVRVGVARIHDGV